jgi:tetratricopeptide (TPR) repeat protein
MKRLERIWVAMAFVCALSLAAGFAIDATAQSTAPGKVHGMVADVQGNPFPGLTVSFRNTTTSQVFDVVTDSGGRYNRAGLPPGNYTISLKQKDQSIYEQVVVIAPGQDLPLDFNFKELQAKQNSDAAQAETKAAEARAKFAAMKGHFDAGTAALDQAKQTRAQMDKLPKDQQATLQSQLDTTSGTAVTELKAAVDATPDDSPNRHIVLAKLGDAYETDAKYTDAADAYAKAVALHPDPGYYNNEGNCLARTGKVDDALVAYQKAIALDPMNTAMYWRNFAVGLYNTGRIKESVDPLRKATDADPKSAQAWYLLGAALVNTMEFKQDGDKVIPVMQPGTIEAYQKAIDLDPNGPYGAQAKQGLEALQAMGVGGINTKLNQPSGKGKK